MATSSIQGPWAVSSGASVMPLQMVIRGLKLPPPPNPADPLRELRNRARERVARSRSPVNTWTRIEVTPEIELSVRGIDDEDEGLVERVSRAMWRLVGVRGAEMKLDLPRGPRELFYTLRKP